MKATSEDNGTLLINGLYNLLVELFPKQLIRWRRASRLLDRANRLNNSVENPLTAEVVIAEWTGQVVRDENSVTVEKFNYRTGTGPERGEDLLTARTSTEDLSEGSLACGV